MYDEQRRPFAYVCYSRCGGSDPVVKSLDMNIHDHIANREHSPKTSADGHRPPIMCIYGPICRNLWAVGHEPATREIVEDEWHNG